MFCTVNLAAVKVTTVIPLSHGFTRFSNQQPTYLVLHNSWN